MQVSAHITSLGTQTRVQDRTSRAEEADAFETRRAYERPEDGRRQGNPWRRPRPAAIRARETEERQDAVDSSLSFRAAAVRSNTVKPDSVRSAGFAALARATEFWALLGAAAPDVKPQGLDAVQPASKQPSLHDLLDRAVARD